MAAPTSSDEKISPAPSLQPLRPPRTPSSVSTGTSTSYNEKDIEAGRQRRAHSPSPTSRSESLLSDYDEAVVRVTTQDDPTRNDNVLGRLRSGLSRTTTKRTTRTQEEVEAILGTEYEVRWEKDDPENPQNWTLAKKGWIMALVSLQTLIV